MGMSEWNGARQDGGASPGRGRSRDHGPQWDQPPPGSVDVSGLSGWINI